MNVLRIAVAAALVAGIVNCTPDDDKPLTGAEAREALDESNLAAEVEALTAEGVEIGTDFTIGEGVQTALETLRDFYQSQVPCAEVTLVEGTVTVNYGVEEGCEFRGKTYTGAHAVRIAKAEAEGIEVAHEWTDFSNGHITVSGTAGVTWSLADKSRRVQHDMSWTDGEREGSGTGDRVQKLLDEDAGLAGGISIEGERTWTGAKGTWTLSVEGVQARPQDPVPQAGTYRLTNPDGKSLSLSFERVDEARIRVTIAAGKKDFSFIIRANGLVEKDE